MTPEALLAAVAGKDDAQACRAVRACAEWMRGNRDGDLEGLAAALVDLARGAGASAEIRQAVADACDAFPDPFFDEAQDLLAKDPDDFVVGSARRARERRARAGAEKAKRREKSRVVAARMADVARDLGKGATRPMLAAVRAGADEFVSRLFHELGRGKEDADIVRAALRGEAEKARPNGATLLAHLRKLEELVAYDWSKVTRARLWASPVRPVFVSLYLRDVVAAAAETVAKIAPRARIVNDVPPGLEMHADRFAMGQALENVMKNAAEAYAEGVERAEAEVRVSAKAVDRDARIAIAVADRGLGMSDEQKANLYVSFGSQKKGGTGLGMLIAQKMIVEVHAGELRVESARGEGTTVTFVVPARQEKLSG